MKRFFALGVLLFTIGLAWYSQTHPAVWEFRNNLVKPPQIPQPTPLVQYSFNNLRSRSYDGSTIHLDRVIKDDDAFTAYVFSYLVDGKKVTGQANIPKKSGKLPVIIMIRGYADKEGYFTGSGTHKVAVVFAQNGFITLAPDFLGFGGSDPETDDILENRFEKPVVILTLLDAVKTLPQADTKNKFIWAHSNGGQIALSVLEISGKPIPTALWAPVTRGFPQGVLDYVGDLDAQGQLVLDAINNFIKLYDSKQYSVTTYLSDIKAPIQFNQGTADQQVKEEWSREFVNTMKGVGKNIMYYTYRGDDHNLRLHWDEVVARNMAFYKSHIIR